MAVNGLNFLFLPKNSFLTNRLASHTFAPQLATVDVMTADLNKSHLVSMFSVKSGSSLNREATLLAKVCLTFLSASNSHFILYAFRALNYFLVIEWFRFSKCRRLEWSVNSSACLLTRSSATEETKSAKTIQK